MDKFSKLISVRWSDLDPNFHLRHSVYYDFGAQQRIELLQEMGLTPKLMTEQHFGPVIFREECVFKREIRLIEHEFLSADKKVLAVLTVDGAWMDTHLRKLVNPTPEIVLQVMNSFPKSESFE